MAKIAFFEIEKWEEEILKNAFPNEDLIFNEGKLDEKVLYQIQDATMLSIFIYSVLNKDVLNQLPNLKFIATRSTGFDHIDLPFCREKGILVANVPTYGVHTVAEHTFALILALSRKIIPSVEHSKRGNFSLDGLRGMELYEKTIGVVGAGNIGKKVIQIANGLGMKILVLRRSQKEDDLEKTENLKVVSSLDELLSSSDIITLHLPLNKETQHLINMANIRNFKKGSILINTARGGLVETQAILEGLEKGILSAAGIDVLEEECSLKEERALLTTEFLKSCDIKTQLLNHVLLTRDDVVITPHNAFNSKEALLQIIETTISNIKSFLNGKPQNLVSVART